VSGTPPNLAQKDERIYKYFATTVALITSHDTERGSNVMACEWTINVCWQPLRIMAIIHQEDLTHEIVSASKEFGVNICSERQAALSNFAGNVSGHKYNKLDHPLFRDVIYPATHIKAPLIRGCLINAECVVEQIVELGEYTGFVGQALAANVDPDLRPLLYHQSKYYSFGDVIPKEKLTPGG
jgi:flavin reductase (DIM6/NTAB) family NADH-FMN oxidoreductase RutF